MDITAGLNIWAVPVAAVAAFVFGAVYYMALSKPWRAASGVDPSGPAMSPPPAALAMTFLAELVMAWVFARVLLNLGRGGFAVTFGGGITAGLLLWAGFILVPMIVNNLYQGAKRELTIIDGGHWLGVMMIEGAILGALALK